MNATLCAIIVGLSCCVAGYGETQGELYSSNHEPAPPEPFPAPYKDYQILPGTISPDQQYAVIYPKRSRLYKLHQYGLFLAVLKPFHILSQLPLGNSNLAENVRCDFESNWAPDSSAVVMIADSRWGPEKVSVVAIRGGKVTQQTELTAQVRRLVGPSFRNAHAERYNDYYDFVFSGGYSSRDRHVKVPKGTDRQGWDLDAAGHVLIECVCTTDPKDIEPHHWTVRVNGVWDIGKGVFLKKEFVRIPFSEAPY